MITKAERTSRFIIETIAPIFCRQGYEGTSLSEMTRATGLTKGAIYGNFENKDMLYIESFSYLFGKMTRRLNDYLEKESDPMGKLMQFTEFYKNYYELAAPWGGCPLLNFGVDSVNHNKEVCALVREGIDTLQGTLHRLIEQGREQGQIRRSISPETFSRRFFSLIQGAVYMTYVTDYTFYLKDCMGVIVDTINQRFK
ncbi:TetR/AcrR family transcriptional regulator [Robertkochia aurantiaca]|uniref:TetR/AcrR family transcriptional regulator n=1 Tax=Robertkochia aurantiaca TaxID=2873700 RepID=UPI001CCA18B5|nr:TetR/AcrR family transcriptional regulator [Robertkochia sp. 3YJGBD-33]